MTEKLVTPETLAAALREHADRNEPPCASCIAATPPPSEDVDAARGRVERSVLGRCIDPRCPSQHVGDARDCIIAAFDAIEAAIRAVQKEEYASAAQETIAAIRAEGLDVERLARACETVLTGDVPYYGATAIANALAAEYARLGGER